MFKESERASRVLQADAVSFSVVSSACEKVGRMVGKILG